MKYHKKNILEARETLTSILKQGDTIFSITRRTSKSGLQKSLDFIKFIPERPNQPYRLNRLIAYALNFGRNKNGEVIRHGHVQHGQDLGSDTVYQVSTCLFNDGNKLNHQSL